MAEQIGSISGRLDIRIPPNDPDTERVRRNDWLAYLKNIDVVVVSSTSHKLGRIEDMLRVNGFPGGIAGAVPVEPLDEAKINEGWNMRADLVAAAKVYQLVFTDWQDRLAKAFTRSNCTRDEFTAVTAVAHDAMLDFGVYSKYGHVDWYPTNKPDSSWDKGRLFSYLCELLCVSQMGVDVYPMRLRGGLAALDLLNQKGAVGQTKDYFLRRLLTTDEVAVYVYGLNQATKLGFSGVEKVYQDIRRQRIVEGRPLTTSEYQVMSEGLPLNMLLATNSGIQMDHPVMDVAATVINGVVRTGNPTEYWKQKDGYMKRALGCPSQLVGLIATLDQSLCSNKRKWKGNYPELRASLAQLYESDTHSGGDWFEVHNLG